MGCDIIKGPDGITTIACSRGRKPTTRCAHCDRTATKACDFKAVGRTCDKPLCGTCAVRMGRDIDYCPDHPRPQESLFRHET